MNMYIEPELEIIKFEETQITTIEVSEGHVPGTPDIVYRNI